MSFNWRAHIVLMCQHVCVGARHIALLIGAATAVPTILFGAPTLSAQAAECPDAEVIFARGTTEAPGLGPTGEAFVNSLRSRVTGKTVGVYAVDYPATMDFPTAVDGISDARAHVLATASNCTRTKMVIGGFSQGAAIAGFVTASVVPDGVHATDVPTPLPPDISDHVAAVALFGKPSTRFMKAISEPPIAIGPLYAAKTIDLCVDNDLVCASDGRSFSAHNQYEEAGMVDKGASFVANQLQSSWAADAIANPPAAGPAPGPVPAPAAPATLTPLPAAPGPSQHLPAPVAAPGPAPAATPSPLPPAPRPAPIDPLT